MNTYIHIFIGVILVIFMVVIIQAIYNKHINLRQICHRGTVIKSCIIPIGYDYDSNGGIVCNSFGGGVSLPTQLLGSTFKGKLYEWDSDKKTVGSVKYSISRLDGLANGITAITWGLDRNDSTKLGGKTTVEHCTGYGIFDKFDLSCGWETGVIYAGNRSEKDFRKYTLMAFIHIYKIDIVNNEPYKLRMWESLVDDEMKSLLYINQLKNNIGLESIISDKYIGEIDYIEMFYDKTQGIDVPPIWNWSADTKMYRKLNTYKI